MKISEKIKIDYAELGPEQQIPAHVQDTWELAYVVTGRGMRTIGDTTEPFSEGEVILVPPGMIHQWIFDPSHTDSKDNIADIALFIPPGLLDEISALLPEFAGNAKAISARATAVKFEGKRKRMLQKLMLRLSQSTHPEIKVICFLSLLSLLGADEDHEIVVGNCIESTPAIKKADKARIYCECNYMKRISLEEAALHMGMNVSSFCKFFLRNFGCTFTEHINSLRIRESCRLLKATSDPVADIAYTAGFTSVPYFNRIFRRLKGCSPSQFRTS